MRFQAVRILQHRTIQTTDDDGSTYPVFGCTDPAAGNFDQDADTDDGSCDYGPWDVSSTDCSMTVLLPADLDISVEGELLQKSGLVLANSMVIL